MNIEETKKAIEVMQAYVDGKEIQAKSPDGEIWTKWKGHIGPSWNWKALEYRVVPEPREWYEIDTSAMYAGDTDKHYSIVNRYHSIADFKAHYGDKVPYIKVREVIE